MTGKFRHGGYVVACLGLLASLSLGCNGRPYITEERLNKGLVVILPGIEGPSVLNAAIRKGLMDGGVQYAIEIHNWHGPRTGWAFTYAWDEGACRKRAASVAKYVERYRERYPGRPVFLVGHSAGGGIAIFAAEDFPEARPLDGLIAIAPSLGPDYDLTRAIEGSGNHMVSCSSSADVFLRGLIMIGRNIDGHWGETAGQEGFFQPSGADAESRHAYAELKQIRWDPSMMKEGHMGGHFGWTQPAWIADNLVPIINEWAAAPERSVVRSRETVTAASARHSL